jgi:hypothetical protein
MLNAARRLPAGPGKPQADVFPLGERLRFRDNFGFAFELRARGAFRFRTSRRARGPLLIAIVVHWQTNAEAWPSQEALARFIGWSSRAVRDQANALELGGFLRLRRERRAGGSERIFYAPALVTLAALAAFVERFPRDRAKPLRRPEEPRATVTPLPLPTVVRPPEAAAAAPAEGTSMKHRDQDQIEPSSCDTTSPERENAHAATACRAASLRDDSARADGCRPRAALRARVEGSHPMTSVPKNLRTRVPADTRTPVPTVAVLQQKGGSGKTTLAINLAAAAHLDGERALGVDMDRQASAFDWSAARQDGSPLDGLSVVKADKAMVLSRCKEIAGHDYVFLDGPPRLGDVTQS